MKKSLALISSLTCILILGGCANTVRGAEQPPLEANGSRSSTSEPSPGASGISGATGAIDQDSLTGNGKESSTSVVPDPWTLTEPPELVVSTEYDVDRVSAQCYTYEWSVKLEGDMMSSVIACGAHPLDSPGEPGYATLYTAFPAGSLPPLEEGQLPGMLLSIFYLDFGEIPPETVTVNRWPAAYVGHASEHFGDSEQVTVDNSDGFMLLPQGDGEFIYEVHADWGLVGNVYYVFRTVPEVRNEP